MKCIYGFILLYCCMDKASAQINSLSLENFLLTGPKALLPYADSVAKGVQQGLNECYYQFRWERWHCPHAAFLVYNGNQPITRESSFARAVSSGSVLHTVTTDCSTGQLHNCKCDPSKQDQTGARWVWGGCSDNVAFGDWISRLFIDSLESGKDARAAVNLHNNDAGRKAVKRTMKVLCKCHGVSGSCSTKTCWRQLSTFRAAGTHLKKRYNKAIKVDFLNTALYDGKRKKQGRFSRENRNNFRKTDLLFLELSPDYCMKNGSHQTIGRECSKPSVEVEASRSERKSCKELCTSCGLDITRKVVEVQGTCHCKFYWCCSVKCKLCKEVKEMFTCTETK